MKLSVSIVTYNHEQYIGTCLDSILSQATAFEYEIVVGDDASTDNTRYILQSYANKYPTKIKLILQKTNIGAQKNFSDVVMACTGDYIAHIDGDDLMYPGKLQKQVDFFEAHPECSIVCHNLQVFDDSNGNALFLFNSIYKQQFSSISDLIKYGTFFGHSSKMYRRTSLPIEGVDFNTRHVGDWLLHIQNARMGDIGYIDEVLGAYRKHHNSASAYNLHKLANVLKDLEYTLNKASEYVSDTEAIQYGFARIYYIYAWNYFQLNEYKEFKRLISKSVAHGIYIDDFHRKLYTFRNFPRFLFTIRKIKNFLMVKSA